MSYTHYNFRSKKALKEAVEKQNKGEKIFPGWSLERKIRCYNPGLGGDLSNHTGKVYLEGPHYPEAHKWYAEGEMKDGVLIKVK
jgi:hypothetical protein